MYAGAAYVLIELANNVVVPLNLPDWTPRLVILIALVGFPIIVVLSWIFDITPEGINRTEVLSEHEEHAESSVIRKRRLRIGDIVIVVLIILVAILAYPRIAGNNQLKAMTTPVTVVNEFGENETHRVFKQNFIHKLALFPFTNESNDTSLNWLRFGIFDLIYEDQLQFENIQVGISGGMTHLTEMIDYCRNYDFPHFLTGSYAENDGVFAITSTLYNASNGNIINRRTYKGKDLFNLIDSISYHTRLDLRISEKILNSTPDLPVSELVTGNLEAYKYYLTGNASYSENLNSFSYKNLYHAVQMDSAFARAFLSLSYWNYNFQNSYENCVRDINSALLCKHRLSDYHENNVRLLFYLITGEDEKAVKLAKMQSDLRPNDPRLLENLYSTYHRLGYFPEAEKAILELNKMEQDRPDLQIELAHNYLLSGNYELGLNIIEKLLSENPENPEALIEKIQLCLCSGDVDLAEEAINQALLWWPEQKNIFSPLYDHLGFFKSEVDNSVAWEDMVGEYRCDLIEQVSLVSINNGFLISRAKTQRPASVEFQIADTSFVSVWYSEHMDLVVLSRTDCMKDSRGNVAKIVFRQSNAASNLQIAFWREDSLILQAKALLSENQSREALSAFKLAFDQNPDHYYLANFIKHLEFVLSPEFKNLRSDFDTCLGTYGELTIFKEVDRYFLRDQYALMYEILPLEKNQFMVPGRYQAILLFEKENGRVIGLNYTLRDNEDEYYQRTSSAASNATNQS